MSKSSYFMVPFFYVDMCCQFNVLVVNSEQQWFKISDIVRALGYIDSTPIVRNHESQVKVF
jgi:prophage antirepressor-like protein